MQNELVLSVEALSIFRNQNQVLDDIDWQVHQGEQWAILGANGCGKSSLLSAITGYFPPTSGRIRIGSHHYGSTNWKQLIHREVGIVSNALSRHVPGHEYAVETVLSGAHGQIGFWTRETSPDTQQARACLEQLGIADLAERPWQLLSQGERQRVFIARSLMTQPSILVLDEPCSGLDPVARESFLRSYQQLLGSDEGLSTVLVTHHLEELIPAITHVLLLKAGKVIAAGPKTEILSSANLSETFGAALTVGHDSDTDRWSLNFR